MMGVAASSPRLQGCPPRCGSPKLMQPRQILETSRPVEPSLVYSTCALLWLWPGRAHQVQAQRLGPWMRVSDDE